MGCQPQVRLQCLQPGTDAPHEYKERQHVEREI
jgi:hypothetical protein